MLLRLSIIIILLFAAIQIIAKPCCCSRWDIKTLSDDQASQINFKPLDIDFAGLSKIDSLKFTGTKSFHSMERLPDEMQVYRFKGKIIKWTAEDDGDYHLIISSIYSDDSTIVCEIPSELCDSEYQKQFKENRNFVESIPSQRYGKWHVASQQNILIIEGVTFHDFMHSASGVSHNCLEIHPILKIWLADG